MHVVVGWPPPVRYDRELAMRVMNLCASMRRRAQLESVLVTLPPADPDRSRSRVFTLLQSLHSAGVSSAGVLVSLTSLHASDLDECLSAGVRDFVFIEESISAREALHIVGASRLRAMPEVRVRVWLAEACRGAYQNHMAAWMSAFDFAVEVAPAPFALANGSAASSPSPAREVHALTDCEWLKSVVTVAEDGSLLPCPAHRSLAGSAVSAKDADTVMAKLAEWHGALGRNAVCVRCDRPIRFGIADWLGSRQVPGPAIPPDQRKYHDYVGRNAAETPPDELEQLIDKFAQRIDCSSGPGGVQ